MFGEPFATDDLERVFLLPGEFHTTKKPKMLVTLLGSCVAVCLYNIHNKSAAMNHFLRNKSSKPDDDVGYYGNLSIRNIVESLLAIDGNTHHYQAKIYGGAAVVDHLNFGEGIGKQNIATAEEVLAQYNIPIVERNVGERRARKIYFNTSDFNVVCKIVGVEQKDFSKRDIRVLIVDDSAVVRSILRKVIEATEGFTVVGEAADAYEARTQILELNPDVMSLDIIMPRLNGLNFLERIMKFYPIPTVICSTIAKEKTPIVDKAMKLGAVGVIDKDKLDIYQGLDFLKRDYIPMLRVAAKRHVEKK